MEKKERKTFLIKKIYKGIHSFIYGERNYSRNDQLLSIQEERMSSLAEVITKIEKDTGYTDTLGCIGDDLLAEDKRFERWNIAAGTTVLAGVTALIFPYFLSPQTYSPYTSSIINTIGVISAICIEYKNGELVDEKTDKLRERMNAYREEHNLKAIPTDNMKLVRRQKQAMKELKRRSRI